MDEESTYQPKHMETPDNSIGHCCFSGCRVGPCGCCTNMPWHRGSCELNPAKEFEDAMHDIYVESGQRKHLRKMPEFQYTPSLDWGAFPVLRLLDDR